ncbi:unnamed protein product [Tilletia controversa]|uniref:mitogen-activated protein kinase kinase kinase n=3 Tax=Tilletia TaxID=13289 RepID=A0A8X7MRS7_9BASI|nr:hypothetical protein CF336_g5121 [Tilletia laevis]KAE8194477.1 hypothetical protein CF328_g4735 [Tilletia controversa]KAE8260264.1 hypothetical protein A4X03_0g3861 [Tilletia caries]KAE8198472.1 hypothetical protein CF335_g4379 [Tilletia laevis]KAE8245588.1 hypothetical protein A4X06_0g5568 [Tilletia controversa]
MAAAAAAAAATGATLSADSVRRWSTADVAAWLHSVRLDAHAHAFQANHINGQVILDVDKNALRQMGIATVGDRVRLDKAIRDLKRAITPSPSSAAASTASFHRPITASHSADQLGIYQQQRPHSGGGAGPAHLPLRQASAGLLVNHHHQQNQYQQQQLYAYNQQQQQQQQLSGHYHSSPYTNGNLTLPYTTASGACSAYSLSPAGGSTLSPYPAHQHPHLAPDAHNSPLQARPGTGSTAAGEFGGVPGSSAGVALASLSSSYSSTPSSSSTTAVAAASNAFSTRRSAHQRPPPLQLAHSANNYALPSPNSNTLAPTSVPGRPRSSSSISASAPGVAGSGNPLTHSLYVRNGLHHPTPGQQQASAQAAPTGPPPTSIIGSGWTTHPAQQRPSTMQSVAPGVRNHNASSYVKKGYGTASGPSGVRPDKNAELYAHQAGAYGAYGGYYPGSGGPAGGSGHAHHLSTSSNSSTSAASAQLGGPSTASSPTAAIFTPATARPGGGYGGSDESGLDGANSPYSSRTPTTPSNPGDFGGPGLPAGSHAISIHNNNNNNTIMADPRLRSVYQPVGLGGSSLSSGNMLTLEDVKRRTLKFHCEDLRETRMILVSDCRDAYDVLARVLRKFNIRGDTGINAYPPYHGQKPHDSESDEPVDENGYVMAHESDDTWAIFASSPDGKTKMLSDNELIAVCHAPQPHDPLRERGLHLRRIGSSNSRVQQTRRANKLKGFFGESEIPEAGSAAAGAGSGQISPGLGVYDPEGYEHLAPLSSNASRKPKMNRASTISFMSGLGLGAGRNSATAVAAEREQMVPQHPHQHQYQHQQNVALQQFREQHSAQIVQLTPYPQQPAVVMYTVPGASAQAAFSNEISAPLQPPPIPPAAVAAVTAAAAAPAADPVVTVATPTSATHIPPSTSGSSMLGLIPRRARHFFGQRPPSELISSNLQDYFPATEKKVLERTARKSIYGRGNSMRSKRDSTWSFKPPDGILDLVDDEEEGQGQVPVRRSGESYEIRKVEDGGVVESESMRTAVASDSPRNGGDDLQKARVERALSNSSSQSGTSSDPGRVAARSSRTGKNGAPMLPPVVGRYSLDDWSASLQTVASPLTQHPSLPAEGPASVDSMPETPTAVSRGMSTVRNDGSFLAPAMVLKKEGPSASSSVGSSTLPPSSSYGSMHLHRPHSVRRNSGESSRSRRSFARFQQYGHTGERDRDRGDAASLLTVDEITQDIESRSESAQILAMSGAEWLGATIAVGGVTDADGNPVPTRKSMTGRWTGGGDTDSISIRSKKPTILLTDDDHSSIAARSLRSLKRNQSSASRKRRTTMVSVGASASGSGRSSVAEERKEGAGVAPTSEESTMVGASPTMGGTPQAHPIEEDEEGEEGDDEDDEEDGDFEEGDELDEEEEPDEAEEVTHPAHRAGKARRKWIKGALIGAGSFGSVYLGMDQRTGLYMAVKQVELPTGKSDNEQRKMSMLEALEREIALLKTLEHPNIVQYLDSYADDSHLNIFLEYVPGGSVVAILRDWGTFQEPLVQAYITQTLLGLQFLHGRNIVHSDIKGANILVDTKGQIKISDFGISKKDTEVIASSGKAPKKTALQGSVFWMAPEAVKQTSSSRKADIWSVGCLVVEMLTGMHPWPSLNQMQALFRIGSMKATPPMPEDISDPCRHFLNWTFELDHTKRPTADDLLAHQFLLEVAQLEPDEPQGGGGSEAGVEGGDTTVTVSSTARSRVLTVNTTNMVGSVASGRKGKGGKRKQQGAGVAVVAAAAAAE